MKKKRKTNSNQVTNPYGHIESKRRRMENLLCSFLTKNPKLFRRENSSPFFLCFLNRSLSRCSHIPVNSNFTKLNWMRFDSFSRENKKMNLDGISSCEAKSAMIIRIMGWTFFDWLGQAQQAINEPFLKRRSVLESRGKKRRRLRIVFNTTPFHIPICNFQKAAKPQISFFV